MGREKDKDDIRPIVGKADPLELGIQKGLKPKIKSSSRFPKNLRQQKNFRRHARCRFWCVF